MRHVNSRLPLYEQSNESLYPHTKPHNEQTPSWPNSQRRFEWSYGIYGHTRRLLIEGMWQRCGSKCVTAQIKLTTPGPCVRAPLGYHNLRSNSNILAAFWISVKQPMWIIETAETNLYKIRIWWTESNAKTADLKRYIYGSSIPWISYSYSQGPWCTRRPVDTWRSNTMELCFNMSNPQSAFKGRPTSV